MNLSIGEVKDFLTFEPSHTMVVTVMFSSFQYLSVPNSISDMACSTLLYRIEAKNSATSSFRVRGDTAEPCSYYVRMYVHSLISTSNSHKNSDQIFESNPLHSFLNEQNQCAAKNLNWWPDIADAFTSIPGAGLGWARRIMRI